MRIKEIAVALFGIILLATLALVWFGGSGLKRAPDVELNLIKQGKIAFSQIQKQRPVLLTFWATDCSSCRKEVPHLVDLYHQYHEKGFDIIAVAMSHDPPNRVWEFVRAKQLPYKIVLDLDSKVAQAFGDVRLTPTTYVIAKDGRIVFHKIGEFDVAKMRALIERLLAEV